MIAESVRDGPAAPVADARDRQRDILRDAGGLRVQLVPSDLPAVGDDLPLVRRLARQTSLLGGTRYSPSWLAKRTNQERS
jgi:hypothetical protein